MSGLKSTHCFRFGFTTNSYAGRQTVQCSAYITRSDSKHSVFRLFKEIRCSSPSVCWAWDFSENQRSQVRSWHHYSVLFTIRGGGEEKVRVPHKSPVRSRRLHPNVVLNIRPPVTMTALRPSILCQLLLNPLLNWQWRPAKCLKLSQVEPLKLHWFIWMRLERQTFNTSLFNLCIYVWVFVCR